MTMTWTRNLTPAEKRQLHLLRNRAIQRRRAAQKAKQQKRIRRQYQELPRPETGT